jgi:hypothetical protein
VGPDYDYVVVTHHTLKSDIVLSFIDTIAEHEAVHNSRIMTKRLLPENRGLLREARTSRRFLAAPTIPYAETEFR